VAVPVPAAVEVLAAELTPGLELTPASLCLGWDEERDGEGDEERLCLGRDARRRSGSVLPCSRSRASMHGGILSDGVVCRGNPPPCSSAAARRSRGF
jgi:hypothetical protein